MNDVKKYYVLDKVSVPSFTFASSDISMILWILEQQICGSCMDMNCDDGISKSYPDMEIKHQIQELLWTPCGAEYVYYEHESYSKYIEDECETLEQPGSCSA